MKKLLSIIATCAIVTANKQTIQAQPTNGLVSQFSFNRGLVINDIDMAVGASSDGATLTSDRFGNPNKAFYFNGTDGMMIFAPSAANDLNGFPDGFSISAWINQDELTSALKAIVVKWNQTSNEQYALFAQNNNNLVAVRTVNTAGIADNAGYSANTWYHVVFTFDRSNNMHKIYVNKVITLSQTTSGSVSYSSTTTHLGIGGQYNDNNGSNPAPNRFFKGKIDDVRIYNRVLSQSEVDELYDEPNPVLTESYVGNGLVAKYSFNNGNANDEIDQNHGIVTNATLTTDRFGNPDKAYNFNGTNSMIRVPHSSAVNLNYMNAFTISTWIQPAANSAGLRSIITKWGSSLLVDNFGLFYNVDKNTIAVGGGVNSVGTNDAANYQPNTWYHVVFTFDKSGNQQKVYVNTVNTLNHTNVPTYSPPASFTSLSFGAQANDLNYGNPSPERFFHGKIDDIRIYNRVLTPTEIDDLYNEPDPGVQGCNGPAITSQSGSSVAICADLGQVDLFVNATGDNVTYQWQYSPDNVVYSDIPGATNATYAATQAGYYKVIVTACSTSITSEIINTWNADANTTIILGDEPQYICLGNSINLFAQTAHSSTYYWAPNEETTMSISVSPTETTVYTLYATAESSGCVGTASRTVIVLNPQPVIAESNGELSTGVFDSYQWSKDGIEILGATGQTYMPAESGNYTVYVTQGPCNATSDSYSFIITGIKNSAINYFNAYPNPVHNTLIIETDEAGNFVLSNIVGEALYAQQIQKKAVIDMESFAAGIYFLTETNSGKTIKVIKE